MEVVRKLADALNRRDADVFAGGVAPDVEWHETDDAFIGLGRVYCGRDAVRDWLNEVIVEPWESFQHEIEEIAEAPDDRVFVSSFITARGRGSGVETQRRFWTVFWFREGLITRRQVFVHDRAEALKAAGLG